MPEKPSIPPTRKPVSEFPTPDPSVAFYTELVNRDDPAYKINAPVKRGALYSTMVGAKQDVIATYPTLFFLRERKTQNDQLVLWDWATDELAHDTYNAAVSYVANSVNYPAFTRTYTIRRELYEAIPTLPIGSPLPGIVAVSITSAGEGYTQAAGVIDGTTVAITFTIGNNGELLNGIITNTGEEIIQNGTEITIIGDGTNATALAVSQPVGCVLTQQSKQELNNDDPVSHEMVQIARVYETLPGPWIYSVRIDKDGALVNAKTRRQVADFITDDDQILAGFWIQTSHDGVDDYVANEKVESRPLPGNPILTSRVEDDGMVTTITKTLVDQSTVVSGETLLAGVWTVTKKEELASTTFVKDTSASEKVCWQVSEARPVPGNPIVSTEVDDDGFKIDKVKTLKDTTTITTQETLLAGVWTRTSKEAVTDLVANEVVVARLVPGAAVPSASIDGDYEVSSANRRLKDTTLITPSSSEGGGFINTVEKKEVTDLVSHEITTQVQWLDKAFYEISIENLIPREFMAFIPTYTTSHILAGTAAMPTLAIGEFTHSQRQLTKLLYENRITSLGSISLPITHTNQELTEEYGGGVLNVTLTLDTTGSQTIDQGYLVVRSSLTVLGNGMDIKETAQLDGVAWPELESTLWDENLREDYTVTTQVVPFGSSPDPDPGGAVFVWLSEIREIDTWRVKKLNTSKPTPDYTDEASALVTYDSGPFRFPGLLYRATAGYYVRGADAKLTQHKIKTWWEKSVSPPTVSFEEIIMDQPIISTLNSTITLAYTDTPVLHDDLTTFNAFFYPATTPSFSEYTGQLAIGTGTLAFTAGSTAVTGSGTLFLSELMVGDVYGLYGAGDPAMLAIQTITNDTSLDLVQPFPFTVSGLPVVFFRTSAAWIGQWKVIGATVTPEKEPNIWKVQTQSVVMR